MTKKFIKKNKTALLCLILGFLTIILKEIGRSGGEAIRGANAVTIGWILVLIGLVIFIWSNVSKK